MVLDVTRTSWPQRGGPLVCNVLHLHMTFILAARQGLRHEPSIMSIVRAQRSVTLAHPFVGLGPSLLRAAGMKGVSPKNAFPYMMKGLTVAGLGLGLASFNRPPVLCDGMFSGFQFAGIFIIFFFA